MAASMKIKRTGLRTVTALLLWSSNLASTHALVVQQQQRPRGGAGGISTATTRPRSSLIDVSSSSPVVVSASSLPVAEIVPGVVVARKPQTIRREPSPLAQTAQILRANQKLLLGTAGVLLTVTLATRNVALSRAALRRLRRNMLAGATIFTVGDLGAQLLTMTSTKTTARNLDQQRLVTSTCLGAVWAGACVPNIYRTADAIVGPGKSLPKILLKMLLSSSFLSTVGNYVTMFVRRWMKLVCDGGIVNVSAAAIRGCLATCNQDIGKVIRNACKIWPLHDLLSFALISPSIRPITTATVSALWSMYVSLASCKDTTSSSREETTAKRLQAPATTTTTVSG